VHREVDAPHRGGAPQSLEPEVEARASLR
jgi:hypothetical protein